MFISVLGYSQSYNINDVDGQTLYLTPKEDLVIYDSGGPNAPYSSNENYEITICKNATTECQFPEPFDINIFFPNYTFDIEASGSSCNYDRLEIYDNNNNLLEYFCNSNLPALYGTTVGGGIFSSNEDCLTMKFNSDGWVNKEGWVAIFSQDYYENQIDSPLNCGDFIEGDITSAYEGCQTCVDKYNCSNQIFDGYFQIENIYSFGSDLQGPITINVNGDVDFFIREYENCYSCCPTIINCAIGDQSTITFNANFGTEYWLIVDGNGLYEEYTINISCGITTCEDIPDLYCNDLTNDSNDPDYSSLTSQILDKHKDGTLTDGFNESELPYYIEFKKHEMIFKTDNDPNGHLTIDLVPNEYDLDIDLFVYETCNDYTPPTERNNQNYKERNTQSTLTLDNCIYRSIESKNLIDAVFIVDANDSYYAVVDGQSNSAENPNTEGDFDIILTCGKLVYHDIDPISCGTTDGTTENEDNYASYYSCDEHDNKAGNYGPEKVYSFDHHGGPLSIKLEILENYTDLNLYLLGDSLGEPTVTNCIEKSKKEESGYGATEEIYIQDQQVGIYYIVVEGYKGDAGDFKITIDCNQKKCTDCSYCFSYWNNGRDFYFINNYCDDNGGYLGLRENETYEWSIPNDAVDYYMDNTSNQSAEPAIKFLPGTWEVCLKITIPNNGNPIVYECCMIIFVPNGGCNNRPPTCGLTYQQNDDNTFTLDASSSSEVEFYSWNVAGADDGKTYYKSDSDTSIVNLNLKQYGNRCYIVTVYGTNCYGFSKFSVKICVSDNNCNKPVPPGCRFIEPVTADSTLVFEGVPDGWDSYEWNVPDEIKIVEGNNNSQNPKYILPLTGTYTVCLILRSGCSHICLCWTVKRGCCPVQNCDDIGRQVYCNDVINDNNKGLNNYTSDIVEKYDNNNCIVFKTQSGKVYHPSFKSKEVRYKYNDGFKRPVTFDVYLRESDPKFDLDVFLFKDCQNARPINCIDSAGHLTPGLNESVYLTTEDMLKIDDLNIFVDGQSFSYPSYRINEGEYTFAITCGPLDGILGESPKIIPIACGQTIPNNNNTGKNFGSWYSCDPETNRGNNWGRENIYKFTLNQNQKVDINLDILDNVDLSLYLLEEVNVKSCIATGKTKGRKVDEKIIKNLQPGTYYIVVDGFAGDEGRYKLSLKCSNGSNLTFDIDDDVCGTKNSVVEVPIRVKNFTNVASFEFSVNIADTLIAKISGITGTYISQNVVHAGKIFVGWYPSTGDPVTLPDNSIIATLKIKLVGDKGESANLTIKEENGENSQGVIQVNTLEGSVCIADDIGKVCGTILREDNVGIDSVIVKLLGTTLDLSTMTNSNGDYCFEDVPPGIYTITPSKDINHLNGVTGGDLFSIQRHLLHKKLLNSPYKIISADANTSKKVTGGDLFQIQRLILRKDKKFRKSESWKFVDASYQFPDNRNPFVEEFPQKANINHTSGDDLGVDFIGTKIGDVNLTNDPSMLTTHRNNSEIQITVESKDVAEKEEIIIPITVDKFENIGSIQFSLNWNNSIIEFKEVILENSAISITENNFTTDSTHIGQLAMSWYDTNGSGVTLSDNLELFAVKFVVVGQKNQTTIIEITDSPISITVENLDGEITVNKNNGIINITKYPDAVVDNTMSKAITIYPTPFNSGINITFDEIIDSKVKIKVYGIDGELISTAYVNYGSKQIHLNESHFKKNGIFILEISSEKFIVTKKVVKM